MPPIDGDIEGMPGIEEGIDMPLPIIAARSIIIVFIKILLCPGQLAQKSEADSFDASGTSNPT